MGTTFNIIEGSCVWVEDPYTVWIDGQVKKIEGEDVVVLTSDGKEVASKISKVYPKDDDVPVDGVDDMTQLSYLHEPGVLYNLSTRYQLNKIYTYTGSILIAVNPFQTPPDLYDDHVMKQYKGARFGELPPHVFAIADAAFRAMRIEGKSNSILVSGESGAGKTESTKMIMQYLAYLGGHRESEGRSVEQQVLESNPVLEAFGNAKTVRNENSSRFGKFVEIQFNKNGKISGAAIRTYLLERSRVCQISDPERNYHCFYLLCAAPQEEVEKYKLGHPTTFHYLNQSSCYELDSSSDAHQYLATRKAMDIVGISQNEQDAIFRVVAAILHLGNITFAKGEDTDSSILDNEKSNFHLHTAAELLMCNTNALEDALLKRVMVTPEEVIRRSLDPDGAVVSRDGLAKIIYSRLFDWLVDKINASIGQDPNSKSIIGVLDIYGFESFKNNSFEQFCINFTNEKLQQHFNQHIFKMQQEEYIKEEIDWSYVAFVDNQDALDLIEKRPGGIIALLDETCMFPKSTAQTFAEKLYQTFKSHKRFIRPKLARTEFTIAHYAGEVQYQGDQFLDKNKDYIVPEHQDLLTATQCKFIAELFPKLPEETNKPSNKTSKFSSIASRFKLQLQQLMETVNSTEPHYIRCVKPNNHFKPGVFENSNVLQQLRCGGVLEAIRISCSGYPTHKTFSEFLQRFGHLAPEIWKANEDERAACMEILEKMGISDAQIGKTKIFLRAGHMADLDARRLKRLGDAVKIVQRQAKVHIARSDFLDLRKAALSMQSICRAMLGHKYFYNLRREHAAVKIQKNVRGYLCRKSFAGLKVAVIVLQTGMRGYLCRNSFAGLKVAVIVLQTGMRGYSCRRSFAGRKVAVIVLQTGMRRYLCRKSFTGLKVAVVVLQTGMRIFASHLKFRYLKKNKGATVIQAYSRRHRDRLYYKSLLEASIVIQCGWRGMVAKRELEKLKMANLETKDAGETTELQRSLEAMQTKEDETTEAEETAKLQPSLETTQTNEDETTEAEETAKLQLSLEAMQTNEDETTEADETAKLQQSLEAMQTNEDETTETEETAKLQLSLEAMQIYEDETTEAEETAKLQPSLEATQTNEDETTEAEETTMLQPSLETMQTSEDDTTEAVETAKLQPSLEAIQTNEDEATEAEETTNLQPFLEAMQTNEDEANAALTEVRKIHLEATEEASSTIKEPVVLVGDNEKIAALISEVENLKNLLRSERKRADNLERLYAEAMESAEGRRRKLEETERRVHQLQESFNRMISSMSGQFSELKMILSAASQPSSTSGFAAGFDLGDDSDTSSSDSDFTFPAPSPPNLPSFSPDAFQAIVHDLSAEVSGSENWEREREGAFDDFF